MEIPPSPFPHTQEQKDRRVNEKTAMLQEHIQSWTICLPDE